MPVCNDTIQVYTHEHFLLIQSCPNSNFILMNNISVVGPISLIPIFKGSFDGQGFHVNKIVLTEQYEKASLFDTFSGSIRNVTISTILTLTNPNAQLLSGFAITLTDAYFYNVRVFTTMYVENCISGSVIGGAIASTSETYPGLTVYSDITILNCDSVLGGAIGQLDNNYTTLQTSYWSSAITVHSSIRLRNSSGTIGGYVGVSRKSIQSLTLDVNMEILGNNKIRCLVGGVAGVLLGSISHINVDLTKLHVSNCEDSPRTMVGGITTNLTCLYPNCTMVEDIRMKTALFYITSMQKAYVGGAFGILDRVSVSYLSLLFSHIESESQIGGLASIINCTTIDQVAVSIGYLAWIDNRLDMALAGGFGAIIANYTAINNSIIIIRELSLNYTTILPSYFGGFGANVSNLYMINSYAMFTLVTLTVSSTAGANCSFGGAFGLIVYIPEGETHILTSFVAADEVILNGYGAELFNLGGFIGHMAGPFSNAQWFILGNSWTSLSLRLTEFTHPEACPFAVSALIGNPSTYNIILSDLFIKVYFDIVNIKNYKYNTNVTGIYNGIGFLAGLFNATTNLLDIKGVQISNVICQASVVFVKDFAQKISYIPTAPYCATCKNIFITKTSQYFYDRNFKNRFLFTLREMQNKNFYLDRSFEFGDDKIWQFKLDVYPYHTSLPFILRHLDSHNSDPNYATFIVPACDQHMCWDYSKVWYVKESIERLDHQYIHNKCNVNNCVLCQRLSPKICIKCANGYISNVGGDVCLKCHKDCMQCSAPVLEDKCTSCILYGALFRGGRCVVEPYMCRIPFCLLCSFVDSRQCVVCAPGKGVLQETGLCTACMPKCQTCSDYQTCTSCFNYQFEALSGLCEYTGTDCYNTCKFCKNTDQDVCLKCTNESYVLNMYGECIMHPSPYCAVRNCAVCNSANNHICKTCKEGYYLTKDRLCKACEKHCSSCSSFSVCIACIDTSKEPFDGICDYSTECIISNCNVCTLGVESVCLSCKLGYILLENTCQQIKNSRKLYVLVIKIVATLLTTTTFVITIFYPTLLYYKHPKNIPVE